MPSTDFFPSQLLHQCLGLTACTKQHARYAARHQEIDERDYYEQNRVGAGCDTPGLLCGHIHNRLQRSYVDSERRSTSM